MKISDRMKEFYEQPTRYYLPRRTYTIIRCDGKAFHTYTKGLDRPFDDGLINDMDETAIYLCKNIQGAKLAYVQSDEISIVITDFDDIETCAWFDNNIQKMCSVSASLATSMFNKLRIKRDMVELFDNPANLMDVHKTIDNTKLAEFDSRVFQIPSLSEVINYIIFRQQDATRNSISSVAQTYFSHKELEGVSGDEKQEMLFSKKGINWNDFAPKYKRGRLIRKEKYLVNGAERNRWVSTEPPIFTEDKSVLTELIPVIN